MDMYERPVDHDFIEPGEANRLDPYQRDELYQSWSQQLDTVGMQPHAREYLEKDLFGLRSERKFERVSGQTIDYCAGIQFSGTP
jgi:hypothetical protein